MNVDLSVNMRKNIGAHRLRDQLGHLHEAWKELIFLLGNLSQRSLFKLDHRRVNLDLDSSNDNTFLKDNHDHGKVFYGLFLKNE